MLLLQQECDLDESPSEGDATPLAPLSPNAEATVTPPAMETPRMRSDVLLFAGQQQKRRRIEDIKALDKPESPESPVVYSMNMVGH